MKRKIVVFLFVLSLVLVASAAAQETDAESSKDNDAKPSSRYNVVGLGIFNNNVLSPSSYATGLNDFGQVVGDSTFEDIPQGPGDFFENTYSFIWYAGKLHDINTSMEFDTYPFSEPMPQKINDLGQIIGHYNGASECCGGFVAPQGLGRWAFIWQNGSTQSLTGLNTVNAINNLGEIVGTDSQTNALFPLLWHNGQVTILPQLQCATCPPVYIGYALDINDLSQIVGWVYAGLDSSGGGLSHAALWQNGSVKDLGTLGGPNSSATGINIWGQVVGFSDVDCGTQSCQHTFLWEKGVMRDLGTLPGYRNSVPVAINALGQIVGLSFGQISCETPCFKCPPPPCPPGADTRAFLWERGKMSDLADLVPKNSGWELVFIPNFAKGGLGGYLGPTGINNLGQISGTGSTTGQLGPRAYLLVPHLHGQARQGGDANLK